jgi:hypothetical protein
MRIKQNIKLYAVYMDLTKLLKLKELYDFDTRNEYFLLPLYAEILNQSQSNCEFLTEQGFTILFNTLMDDIQLIDKVEKQEDIKSQEHQEALVRLCLYFTIIYNLTLLYSSYCYTLTTDEGKNLLDRFDTDLINYFFEIDKRAEFINKVAEYKFKDYIPHLTEDYLKIFNQEKKRCFTKDIFSTEEELAEQQKPIHIPIHADDVPEGFKVENAIQISSV